MSMVNKSTYQILRFYFVSLLLISAILIFPTDAAYAVSDITDGNSQAIVTNEEHVFGNTPENINFSGWISSDGEFLYYSYKDQYLMKKSLQGDASPITLASSKGISFINVAGDWVYYTAGGTNLIRVRKDGSGKESILQSGQGLYSRVLVVDNHIYYVKNEGVYRMSLDGTNEELILEVMINSISYSDDSLYFSAEDITSKENSGVWKYPLNTGKVAKISEVSMTIPVLVDDTYYYSAWDTQMDQYGLFSLSLSDMKTKRISSDYQYCLNQYKGMLIVIDEDNNLYQTTTDFKKRKSLGKGNRLHVIDGKLYCTNFENDTMDIITLSENPDDFDEVTLSDVENDIDKINQTDYQIPILDNNIISVGPYDVKINEGSNTLTLYTAFLNSYKAICPDSLTLPSILIINGKEYQIVALGNDFSVESNVTELIVPEGIITIDNNFCLYAPNLENLSLPASLTRIGYPFLGMWYNNDKFKELKLSDGNKHFKLIDGVMYSYDEKTLIRAPFAEGEYRVAEGVTRIEAGCFYENSKITKVIVPDGVTDIGPYAFFECEKALEEVVLPDSVRSIGDNAFGFCIKLRAINLPKSLTEISARCFLYTAITEVVIPEGVTTIGEYAFYHCYQIEKLSLPSTLKKINNTAFQINDLYKAEVRSHMTPKKVTISSENPYFKIVKGGLLSKDGIVFHLLLTSDSTYTVPGSVKMIMKGAFRTHTQAKKVIIPKGVTVIPENAFADSWIQEVVLPTTIKLIGQSAFEGSKINKINLPKGLTVIGKYAFLNSNLNKINIPSTVTKIMDKAFGKEGGKLTMIFWGKTPPATLMRQTEHPENEGTVLTIYVPKGSVEAYKKAFAVNHKGVVYTIQAIKE